MEGKCVLFKNFGGVSAFPVCLDSQDVDTIIETVKLLEPSFSGINLEDISAPRCFDLETRLKRETGMLTFHDDQHGTAIVALAGLFNACKLLKKDIRDTRIVINGAGAAGTSIANLLNYIDVNDVIMCDSKGIIYQGRWGLNVYKQEIAEITNLKNTQGSLADAVVGADIFIGVFAADVLTPEIISTIADDPIIFALANPEPEISPKLAWAAGVKIMATGRSDFPNQVNNVLAFPGIFRGALDAGADEINIEMKLVVKKTISDTISAKLSYDYIISKPFDPDVMPAVAVAVAESAVKTGYAECDIDIDKIKEEAEKIAGIK